MCAGEWSLFLKIDHLFINRKKSSNVFIKLLEFIYNIVIDSSNFDLCVHAKRIILYFSELNKVEYYFFII